MVGQPADFLGKPQHGCQRATSPLCCPRTKVALLRDSLGKHHMALGTCLAKMGGDTPQLEPLIVDQREEQLEMKSTSSSFFI